MSLLMVGAAGAAGALGAADALPAGATASSYLGKFSNNNPVASTVPANGDVNPYGVAVVPTTTGHLVRGDVLVSNFNNSSNLQGTGTTIVQVSPSGKTASLFADLSRAPGGCPGGIGLTTALVALRSGWVIVGSLPTRDGSSATMKSGCLIVVDPSGTPVETIKGDKISGPWDMTAVDNGGSATLFVTNVLNGTVDRAKSTVDRGTVVRIGLSLQGRLPKVASETVIGTGFPERPDPSALAVGPTGLGFSNGSLYLADSDANRIASIPDALTRADAVAGTTVSTGGFLNDPLGLAIAPNGDILTANGGDGNLVETTPAGAQLTEKQVDSSGSPPGSGALFGLAVVPGGHGVFYVDDATNTLNALN